MITYTILYILDIGSCYYVDNLKRYLSTFFYIYIVRTVLKELIIMTCVILTFGQGVFCSTVSDLQHNVYRSA